MIGLVIGIGLTLSSCASDPREEVRTNYLRWLGESEREIAVWINPYVERGYQVHTSRALHGAGKGAAEGAMGALAGGAQSNDPYGLVLGILLMPVFAIGGAVYGAATAEPEVSYHSLDEVEGAKELMNYTKGPKDFKYFVKQKLFDNRLNYTIHRLSFLDNLDDEKEIPIFKVYLRHYDLVGKIEKDPEVSLLMDGGISIYVPGITNFALTCEWEHSSWRRKLSEWSKDGAVALRNEIKLAADGLIHKLFQALGDNRDVQNCIN
jgi:hypothetical protein